MTNASGIRDLMVRECDICLHLYRKIPDGGMDFRLTSGQRSTGELLRYLSFVGLGSARSIVEGNWDYYQALQSEFETVQPDGFTSAMERQKVGLCDLFANLTAESLDDRTFQMPWGTMMPLGQALLALPYASLVAYRMQLFLHAKAAGNSSLGTADCWAGRDIVE